MRKHKFYSIFIVFIIIIFLTGCVKYPESEDSEIKESDVWYDFADLLSPGYYLGKGAVDIINDVYNLNNLIKNIIPGFIDFDDTQTLIDSIEKAMSAGSVDNHLTYSQGICLGISISDTSEKMTLPEALRHFGDLYNDGNPDTNPTINDLKQTKKKAECCQDKFISESSEEKKYLFQITGALIKLLDYKISSMEQSTSITITVDDDFIDDSVNHKWDTIQEGLEDANNGDTIIVKSGKYPEQLIIDKQIIMKGEEYPVIDGEETGTVMIIQADNINFEGFEVIKSNPKRENARKGIEINANNVVIVNCIFSNNNIGISSRGENNIISNSKFNNNRIGLVISNGKDNIVENNYFFKSNLILGKASKNVIKNNLIELCPHFGISVYDNSNDNKIVSNTFKLNSMGAIEISESKWGPTSHYNIIYNNNFMDNGEDFQVYDDGNNQWDNGIKGNYWSDYKGVDTDNNGIGEIPYDKIGNFDTNEKSGYQDNYPLLNPTT